MLYIYAYENKINGKMYVGQTVNIKARDRSHIKSSTATGFNGALKKYGRDKFDLFVIDIVDTDEQANEIEIFWIAEMRKFLGRSNVYNLTDGGQGVRGAKRSEESKKKLSEMRMGENNPFFGKTHTEESLEKMRIARENLSPEVKAKIAASMLRGEDHPNFGKTTPDDVKEKISNSLIGVGLGKVLSEETKKKMSISTSGEKNPMFGKTFSDDHIAKLSVSHGGERNANAKLKNEDVIKI